MAKKAKLTHTILPIFMGPTWTEGGGIFIYLFILWFSLLEDLPDAHTCANTENLHWLIGFLWLCIGLFLRPKTRPRPPSAVAWARRPAPTTSSPSDPLHTHPSARGCLGWPLFTQTPFFRAHFWQPRLCWSDQRPPYLSLNPFWKRDATIKKTDVEYGVLVGPISFLSHTNGWEVQSWKNKDGGWSTWTTVVAANLKNKPGRWKVGDYQNCSLSQG